MLLGAGFLQLMTVFNLVPSRVFIALALTLLVFAGALRLRRPSVTTT
jgi:hypothetical protein